MHSLATFSFDASNPSLNSELINLPGIADLGKNSEKIIVGSLPYPPVDISPKVNLH